MKYTKYFGLMTKEHGTLNWSLGSLKNRRLIK